ncbi:MAG: F0F1 ATP synthase subunit B [Patescibacteria group bacterium]|nr:F0F1 ATP synthase subunit B [Patescibacteria group bacterium]MDE1944420.1 F0F1 ATP synthase subunit B [Patescibacteria group bacterium]MDE1945105.1 F0F1 ATP synthase subunit B [Patescibacteria group bacterium]MDE2057615.1 F0F1 ATP synthase subunit B [Patescibacteria group bacterium]
MNQLFAAFGIDWKLLIAQAVNFGIVLFALWCFLYAPVMRMLEKRRTVVAQGVEDARRAAEKLAGADSAAAERVAQADTEAEGIVARARQAASAQSTEIVESARARAEALAKDAALRAEEEKAKALRESEREVARLAILAAEKVMREKAV